MASSGKAIGMILGGVVLLLIGLLSWVVYIPVFSWFYVGEIGGIALICSGIRVAKDGSRRVNQQYQNPVGYGQQSGYGYQSNYGNQPGYGNQPEYGNQSGYGNQPEYGNQSGYGDQGTYGNQSGNSNQDTYKNQPGTGNQSGYNQKPRDEDDYNSW